ncbi:MAG TPA: glycosyltransferase [Candidatus Omnitrophota bacterium]|nr:glycosyltransferase [Candidatus Omnitrophota bacterium]HPS19557.1 glycosyltransferase [Candidatus Omnitrophota bacterium]
MLIKNAKVAIVHDWLTGMRGGEKCLEVFCELFPSATVFTLVHKKDSMSRVIENMNIRTSFLQNIPGVSENYRNFLPLFPFAIERFDLSGFDIVITSSHCVAKGARSPEKALRICYCYTPVRYAWKFFDEYFSSVNPIKRIVIAAILKGIKKWDLKANKRIDYFVAISDNVKQRIKEYYLRDSDIIYPPVNPNKENKININISRPLQPAGEGYFLIVSALVPYKKIDLAIEAFNKSGRRLIIIGKGNDEERLRRMAGPNISFLGWANDGELYEYYAGCKALIFPGEEDFGIVPLEANSYGKVVIAYAKGGILETMVPFTGKNIECAGYPTAVFFDRQTVEALNDAVDVFERNVGCFLEDKIKANVGRFSRERFKKEVAAYILDKWEERDKTFSKDGERN